MFPCLLLSLTDVCVHVCITLSGPLVSCCQQICHSGNTALVWLREEHEASVCVCVWEGEEDKEEERVQQH